ncbi:GNAT family N-acetyltransferase [Streptomyces sp. NPDC090798]|uniref:GNAT family N-acetyltransferase n=1 Tax=Streptomyces sp. NPDC090798 TaxID=3365968 RepID=UPI0037F4C38F
MPGRRRPRRSLRAGWCPASVRPSSEASRGGRGPRTPSADGRASWILGLGVAERLRGRGLARRLMQETLRRLPADGVHEVWLTVEPANTAAITLYQSLGFTEQGARKDYFGPGHDRLLLALRH